MIIYTHDPFKNKEVKAGVLLNDVFVKEVTRKKHFFNLVEGYAIQEDVFHKIREKAKYIKIIEKDTRRTLYISMDDFMIHCRNWTGKNGKQLTISEKYLKEQQAYY